MDRIGAEAADWHAASDGDDMDWDGLTAWLEADPRHATAYDELMLTGAVLDEHRDTLATALPANDDEGDIDPPRRRAWFAWGGSAVAAALVAMLIVPNRLEPSPTIYATNGESRTIALDDGSHIQLAPRSRLEIAGRGQDRLALSGGAWFEVRHDPGRRMTIRAGEMTVQDIGTRFDIQATADDVRVAVADGTVSVAGRTLARPVTLSGGQALQVGRATHGARIGAVMPDQVGSWRDGQLTYERAPLALVASDLARYANVKVAVADSVAARQFSGTLAFGDGQAALQDLSRLMGLRLDRGPAGYRLDPGH